MRITKRQLRRIIKEARQKLMGEGSLDLQREILTDLDGAIESAKSSLGPSDELVKWLQDITQSLNQYFDQEAGF